jgi:ubiquinol-cytochrome c reductase cytochrome b subunit
MPNYLGHTDNYIPANPLVTPAHIVPEWYFLPFYAILRAVPDKLGGVALMVGSIVVWFVLPWLDTSKVRSMRFRPVARIFFFLWVASFFVLMWCGAKPAEQPYVLISQLATAYYFLWFLVLLPVLGRLERPLPLPESIAAAVLGPRAMTPMGAGPLPGGLAPAKPMDKA